jgi:hypothetical protein
MANALKLSRDSIAEVLYSKGSIVVCRGCGKPLYRLQASIYAGEGLASSAWKYAPVSPHDLTELSQRSDLEPGQRAAILAVDWADHCELIPTLKPGGFMDCPACKESFVFGKIAESDPDGGAKFADKGYTIGLAIIPPSGQARRVTWH